MKALSFLGFGKSGQKTLDTKKTQKKSLRMEPLEERQMLAFDPTYGAAAAFADATAAGYTADVIGSASDYSTGIEIVLEDTPGQDFTSLLTQALQTARATDGDDLIVISGNSSYAQHATTAINGFNSDLKGGVTIVWIGDGQLSLTNDSSYTGRILDVKNNTQSITLGGFDISSGVAATTGDGTYGGGIYAAGNTDLTIADSNIHGNTASARGGGIYSTDSNLTLIGVTVDNNKVTAGHGGGVYSVQTAENAVASLTMTDSFVTNNKATASSGMGFGGGILNSRSDMTLTNVTIAGNEAIHEAGGSMGGGIYVNNLPWAGGTEADINIIGGKVYDNFASSGYSSAGGGIGIKGYAKVSGTEVYGNTADMGAGVYLNSAVYSPVYEAVGTAPIVEGVYIHENTGKNGGGLAVDERTNAFVNNSLIVDNFASENGAGVWTRLDVVNNVVFTNVTIAGNKAGGNGGGVYDLGGTLTFQNSILAQNEAAIAADIYISAGQTVTSANSLYGTNSVGENVTGVNDLYTTNPNFTQVGVWEQVPQTDAAGNALYEDPATLDKYYLSEGVYYLVGGTVDDVFAGDPLTLTALTKPVYKAGDYSLTRGSAAIGGGDNAFIQDADGNWLYTKDALGGDRVQGVGGAMTGNVDMGALEYVYLPADLTLSGVNWDINKVFFNGDTLPVEWTVKNLGELTSAAQTGYATFDFVLGGESKYVFTTDTISLSGIAENLTKSFSDAILLGKDGTLAYGNYTIVVSLFVDKDGAGDFEPAGVIDQWGITIHDTPAFKLELVDAEMVEDQVATFKITREGQDRGAMVVWVDIAGLDSAADTNLLYSNVSKKYYVNIPAGQDSVTFTAKLPQDFVQKENGYDITITISSSTYNDAVANPGQDKYAPVTGIFKAKDATTDPELVINRTTDNSTAYIDTTWEFAWRTENTGHLSTDPNAEWTTRIEFQQQNAQTGKWESVYYVTPAINYGVLANGVETRFADQILLDSDKLAAGTYRVVVYVGYDDTRKDDFDQDFNSEGDTSQLVCNLTILDRPTFVVSGSDILEGVESTFTVTRTGDTEALWAKVDIDPTIFAPTNGGGLQWNNTEQAWYVFFGAGVTSVDFTGKVAQDYVINTVDRSVTFEVSAWAGSASSLTDLYYDAEATFKVIDTTKNAVVDNGDGTYTMVVDLHTATDNGNVSAGDLTLAEAIKIARNLTKADPDVSVTITFDIADKGTNDRYNFATANNLVVPDRVTLDGTANGATSFEIRTAGNYASLRVLNNTTVTLVGLDIVNSRTTGAMEKIRGIGNAGTLNISGCTFTDINGVAIDNTGTLTISNSLVARNDIGLSSKGVGTVTMNNVTVTANNTGVINTARDFSISNSIIAKNFQVDITNDSDSEFFVFNSIIGNADAAPVTLSNGQTVQEIVYVKDAQGNPIYDADGNKIIANIIEIRLDPENCMIGTGAKPADPLFVDWANGDYHLMAISPAVNTGAGVLDGTDLDGNSRVVGGIVDMGAYELQSIVVTTLEDTITWNFFDTGNYSLRDALTIADRCPGGFVITFDPSLFIDNDGNDVAQTLKLSQSGQVKGAIVIDNSDVIIQGPGADLLTIDAGGKSSVFSITGGSVTIADMTIANGFTTGNGGGIFANLADLTVENVVFAGNEALNGGGLYSFKGSLTVDEAVFVGNTATQGGAIFRHGVGADHNSAEIKNTLFQENKATLSGGAIYVGNVSTEGISISDSQFVKNSAPRAGAIAQYGNANLTIGGSEFTENTSTQYSGGAIFVNSGNLTLTDTDFTKNQVTVAQNGGAIYFGSTGTLTVDESRFTENSAARGGAIYQNAGKVVIQNQSKFEENFSTNYSGGAIFTNAGNLTISDAFFTGNQTLKKQNGGAIYFASTGNLSIADTQFGENAANRGGALYVANGTTELVDTFFKANEATQYSVAPKGTAVHKAATATLSAKITADELFKAWGTEDGELRFDDNTEFFPEF